MTGRVGQDVDLKKAQEAARVAALNVVSIVRNLIGFDRFKKFVKIAGYVNADPSFYDFSAIMNGASELLGSVFGEAGVHARTSVGVASLPLNAIIEIDAVIQVKPSDIGRESLS
jgi:enamine deaminase RidA (YjgF/YER057c/UK114 family)